MTYFVVAAYYPPSSLSDALSKGIVDEIIYLDQYGHCDSELTRVLVELTKENFEKLGF